MSELPFRNKPSEIHLRDMPAGWVCWDGYFGPTEQWYFSKWGVPFARGDAVATVWVAPLVYKLLWHWAHNLRWGSDFRSSPLTSSRMLNSEGNPMSFEDYVREVLAPASHTP